MREEIARLRDAVEVATHRKKRKRRYIQTDKTLTIGEVSELLAIEERSRRNDCEKPVKRVCVTRRCKRCGESGHNSRTCVVEIEDVNNSDKSEQ
jgi:hypothetical protein